MRSDTQEVSRIPMNVPVGMDVAGRATEAEADGDHQRDGWIE